MSIVGAMVRSGVTIFRCHSDDSSRALEVPQWMFDEAVCWHMRLAPRAIVTCRALYDLRELIWATERVASTPVLQAERLIPHSEGGAHATQDSKESERSAATVRADGAGALDRHTGRDARAHGHTARPTAAPARSRAPRI